MSSKTELNMLQPRNITKKAQQNCPEFKLIIIGDNHVGKKELVDISPPLVGGNEKKRVSSLGVDVHSLSFLTNRGPIKFNVWDSAGGQVSRKLVDLVSQMEKLTSVVIISLAIRWNS